MNKTVSLLAATVLVALALAPAAGAVAATEGTDGATTWSIQPAGADGADARVSLRHTIDPGSSAQDSVTVTNFSEQPAAFNVYASDGIISDSGDFDLLPPGETPVDGGSWVSVEPVEGSTPRAEGGQVIALDAGAAVTLPVTIAVPADASPGDHPAGIVAELVQEVGDAVQMTSRVGVRVHLRVAGDVVAAITPEEVTAAWQPSWNPFAPGVVQVGYALVNDGNVRLGASTVVDVAGSFGLGAASATAETREILPGRRAVSSVELTGWPLVFGWGEVTVTPLVVGEDDIAAPTETASTTFTVWTIPWAQLALLALLVVAFFVIRRQRRRSRALMQARIDAAVAEAVASAPASASGSSPAEPEEAAGPTTAGAARGGAAD
ncbi:DUF916 domain-containing protein [Microbacterium sp. zg.Y625]|uniref:DUF916 domain-containing protein n=1 Tax=Microbacterium jiangjiandongii TaxID=3049071 RepID=UPI00214B71A9|nr:MULTISPECIES: DUF916 domain-containing protein [unclassified Microbacterium]MCR2794037.1 DUF916 domain-containing protein [Microbacterium sp. zg.Y625]WIM25755.1 DUF916 domain-containing protein [Microbacterium sp. zg-Y625]